MTNAYPEKPFIPYKKTVCEMAAVIAYLKAANYPVEVKRTSYIVFRNEGANGTKGVNNNYCGFQADGGRWDSQFDKEIAGVVKKVENGTGKERYFLAFNDVGGCLDMLLFKMQDRGLYIGGTTHKIVTMDIHNSDDLAIAYKKEWVSGSAKIEPSPDEKSNFISMYNQAVKLFS